MAQRKSREEKTIEHAETVVGDLANLYNTDAIAYIEYKHLLDEYKKVTKRFNKTVSMSDSVGKSVIIDNEQLKENVNYTIELAKNKIMYNIEEHRKTKEVLSKHSQTDKDAINRLKKELKELRKYSKKLELELNKSDEIEHEFYETFDTEIKSKEINSSEIKDKSYQQVLNDQLKQSKEMNTPLTIAKLSVDNFIENLGRLEGVNTDKKGLLKVLYKFFTISLGSKNIVYYFKDNTFYILLSDIDIQQSKALISKINIPRKLSNVTFTFSIGVTEYVSSSDDFKSINTRIELSNEKASLDKTSNSTSYI